jgi:pimeloyl-ACP methyl ester carboxylesterase
MKETADVKTRWVTGSYGKLRVEDGGLGGIPVVFVHGLGGNLEVWRAQLAHLRPGRRAIALDLHGMGESGPAADNTYTIPSFADDIRSVADSLGLDRFILVGHSLGGLVVADYAGRYPDKVAGVLFDDPAGDLSGLPQDQAEKWLQGFAPDKYEAFRERWFGEMLSTARTEVREMVMAQVRKTPQQVMAASARGLFAFDPKPPLLAYKGPKLTVITAQNNEPYSLQNVVPGLKSQIVPGTSHWIMMDDPEAFNAVMDQFLATIH